MVHRPPGCRVGRTRGGPHAWPAPQLQGLEHPLAGKNQQRRDQGQGDLGRLGDGLLANQHVQGHRREGRRPHHDRHRPVRPLGHRVRLLHCQKTGGVAENPEPRVRSQIAVRHRRGHDRPRPVRAPLRLRREPTPVRAQPDEHREASSRAVARSFREEGPKLGQGALRLPTHVVPAGACAEHDGQLDRRLVREPRQEGRSRRPLPHHPGAGQTAARGTRVHARERLQGRGVRAQHRTAASHEQRPLDR